jgi:DNA-binding transcriptional regulator YiaG
LRFPLHSDIDFRKVREDEGSRRRMELELINSAQNELRARARSLRRLLRWAQFDLSRSSGICRSKISDWEQGHVDLPPQEWETVKAALARGVASRRRDLDEAAKMLAKPDAEN